MKLQVGEPDAFVTISAEMAGDEWGVAIKANGVEILYIRPSGDVYMDGSNSTALKGMGFVVDDETEEVKVV